MEHNMIKKNMDILLPEKTKFWQQNVRIFYSVKQTEH